ncbi:hypothetical protein [Prescottella agglutinans]|uniref:XRE family transcriptional regulator n=1 Tax=Prescottella agglutinans TaxID=1644129 RepID=A0ABT6MI22_9NOCA|nr:hypothetical protein [Prescottella agglutinans]MDH6283973.1 hypothetical protein [Prescottella agglutinans]
MGYTGAVELPMSERIDTLFRVWRKQEEPEASNEAVAAAVTAAGTPLTADVLADLRAGRRTTADPDTLTAIAAHFRTAPRYLTDPDAGDVHEQLMLLERMRDAKVRSIHLRGEQTSVDRQTIIDVLNDAVDDEDPELGGDTRSL